MASLFKKGSKRKRTGVEESYQNAPPSGGRYAVAKNAKSTQTAYDTAASSTNSVTTNFADLGLSPPLVSTCRKLGFHRPSAVQRAVIPQILKPLNNESSHLLTLAETGSGKTAAFALPLLHILSADPYGIFALILTPTRELAKQIQQQILAIGSGSGWKIECALVIGGEDLTRQSLELSRQPNFVVATPGRCAELCRDGATGGGLYRPNFRKVKFVVLDEADRLLSAKSGFERDVAECLLQATTTVSRNTDGTKQRRVRRGVCRTLLFSATMSRSLKSLEEMAGAGVGRLPLRKIIVREDGSWDSGKPDRRKDERSSERNNRNEQKDAGILGGSGTDGSDGEEDDSSTPSIPAGLRQEYLFMPDRVREAYLLCAVRNLMTHGGRGKSKKDGSGWNRNVAKNADIDDLLDRNDEVNDDDGDSKYPKAQSAIIFVPTCERCAHIAGILTELGISNVALHSLLSQNRRLASLGMFQSQRVRVMVATDVASRGLDVPEVDLVINAELPRRDVDYVHRVGRTARAGRRGRAVSLVGEQDIDLVHQAERISGRKLEKCPDVTDDMAVRLLGPVAKASRLTKMKLMDIGFDELVEKHRKRKRRDRRARQKAEERAKKALGSA